MASSLGTEEDLRFVFCACAISHMLGDWSGVDRDGIVRYVNACVVISTSPVEITCHRRAMKVAWE